MMSLVIYIMAFLVILGIVGTITVFFSNNTKDINLQASASSEYNKFNLYMLKQTKAGNEVNIIETNDNYIRFSNDNKFIKLGNILYFNKIKLCENVNDFKCSVETANNGKDVLKTYIDINGTVYTTDYVLE